MKLGFVALGVAALASFASAKPPAPPTPLFASDTPIHISIQGPMAALANDRSGTARPAVLTADGVALPITLAPRGITRLQQDVCDFPPLRVELTRPAPPATLFAGQHRLKLVTHCKRSGDFQQKVLLEYAAYRMYNLLTPQSFRVRLANVDYLNGDGRPYASRIGFFIEDFSDVAKRNGMDKATAGTMIPVSQLDPHAAARFALFEDLISNYDWSMRAGPAGEPCCHNARLMAVSKAPGTMAIPVPYDFDFSGLVDAPYAAPPEGLPIHSVRERLYRGYCVHGGEATAIAAELAARRSELLGVLATVPGLEPRTQARAASYLDGFFTDLAAGKVLKNCVA
jgi:hypothetical protein